MPFHKSLLVAAALLAPATALADMPAPVCGAPEVLEIVARILNERGLPALIVAPPAGQEPISRPDTGLRAVRPASLAPSRYQGKHGLVGHRTIYDLIGFSVVPVGEGPLTLALR